MGTSCRTGNAIRTTSVRVLPSEPKPRQGGKVYQDGTRPIKTVRAGAGKRRQVYQARLAAVPGSLKEANALDAQKVGHDGYVVSDGQCDRDVKYASKTARAEAVRATPLNEKPKDLDTIEELDFTSLPRGAVCSP